METNVIIPLSRLKELESYEKLVNDHGTVLYREYECGKEVSYTVYSETKALNEMSERLNGMSALVDEKHNEAKNNFNLMMNYRSKILNSSIWDLIFNRKKLINGE